MLNNKTTTKKLFSIMSILQTHYHFQLDFQKVDQHTEHDTNRRKDNKLQPSFTIIQRLVWMLKVVHFCLKIAFVFVCLGPQYALNNICMDKWFCKINHWNNLSTTVVCCLTNTIMNLHVIQSHGIVNSTYTHFCLPWEKCDCMHRINVE